MPAVGRILFRSIGGATRTQTRHVYCKYAAHPCMGLAVFLQNVDANICGHGDSWLWHWPDGGSHYYLHRRNCVSLPMSLIGLKLAGPLFRNKFNHPPPQQSAVDSWHFGGHIRHLCIIGIFYGIFARKLHALASRRPNLWLCAAYRVGCIVFHSRITVLAAIEKSHRRSNEIASMAAWLGVTQRRQR